MNRKLSFLCLLLCGSLAVIPGSPDGQHREAPVRGTRALAVWSTYWDNAEDVSLIGRHAETIQTVSLFAAYFRGDTLFIPEQTLKTLRALRLSHAKQEIYLSVVNDVILGQQSIQKDTAILRKVLSPQNAQAHAREIIRLAQSSGVDGIEIDYENIRSDLDLWAQFLRFEESLIPLAGEAGLGLRIILEPGTPVSRLDFPEGAQYVVMCYNLHGSGTDPGPKADIAFLETVYENFSSLPNRSYALANGGFDWPDSSRNPVELSSAAADALSKTCGAPPNRDTESGALYFSYLSQGIRHTVWYADEQTLALWARELDRLEGYPVPISLWRLP